jgi:hypothetical protein
MGMYAEKLRDCVTNLYNVKNYLIANIFAVKNSTTPSTNC